MAPNTSILEIPNRKKMGRSAAKVKTGCRTCKIRRVKCDEGKPECLRCTSTGRQCDGYARIESLKSKALIPIKSSTLQSSVPLLSEFGNSVLYLEFYHHCAGPTLASNFDHEFWSRTVLQMAHQESAVRHAVIALGYLVKTEPGSLKHARSVSTTDNRKTLLLHYNKAVRCLVDRMAQPSYSVETALVTCLLFVCIEHLRGDYPAAFAHLHSGLKITAEWQQSTWDHPQSSPALSSSSIVITQNVDGPRLIAGNLVPIFTRAITAALLMGAPFEPRLKDFCPHPQTLQGRSFQSVIDAQSALHDLRNATMIVVSVLFRTLSVGNQPTIRDLHDREHLLNCHDSWFQALQMLEREGKLSDEERVVASSLKVSYYSTYIALTGAINVDQVFGATALDAHISSFQAVNHHAKIVIDSMNLPISSLSTSPATPSSSSSDSSSSSVGTQAAAHFAFDISVIFPLWLVATRCRCPATRREAVSLLERNPPREALWDAKVQAVVARRVIEIEESEVDMKTGWPTPRARLATANIQDMEENGGFWVKFIKHDLVWDEWFEM